MDTTKMSVMDFMKPAKAISRDTEISAALRMLNPMTYRNGGSDARKYHAKVYNRKKKVYSYKTK